MNLNSPLALKKTLATLVILFLSALPLLNTNAAKNAHQPSATGLDSQKKKQLKQPTDEEYPANLWNNYETYIEQLREKTGINALRISIEWPLVQPEGPNSFDLATLDHYASVVACLINNNITPIVCFHHYTNPCWFCRLWRI